MGEFRLRDYNLKDTIAAIATFPEKAALGVIKLSGPKAINIISKIFVPRQKKDIRNAKTYTLHYGWIKENAKGKMKNAKLRKEKEKTTNIVDEVLVSIMRKPRSYTKEDVAEISCHGGIFVLNKILEIILKEGARLALAGEFSYRALIRGRIDLAQAESIINIVEAKSEEALRLATRQLSGETSRRIDELKKEVKNIFVQTESCINFPEDDLEISFSHLEAKLKRMEKELNRLLEGSFAANILKDGVKCVICGKANAGKSTLFNCLLKEERVIVSKVPGTTRDVIEETINIKGVPLRIYDTAGILEPRDLISKKAIEKSHQAFDCADLAILILDGSVPLNKDDLFLLEKVKNKDTILVINKIDLKQRLKLENISQFRGPKAYLSALKGRGIKNLEKAIFESVYKEGLDRKNLVFLNQLQREILKKVKDNIAEARNFFADGYTIDFVNLCLKEALDNLAKLTGEVISEEILESIFSNFCIGK